MADKISFVVDFTEAKDYSPIEGIGTSDLLKLDGFYGLTITKVTLGKSKESGNPKFILSTTVVDEDEKGKTIIADVLAGGKDKNGNPNSRQLWDLFYSMGYTQEQVRALSSNGQQAGDAVATSLVGKTVYASIEAETYNGNTSSKVKNFIAKTRYTDAAAANAHRKPRKADTTFTGAPVGVTQAASTMPTFGLPTPAPTANGALIDPLAQMGNLGLRV